MIRLIRQMFSSFLLIFLPWLPWKWQHPLAIKHGWLENLRAMEDLIRKSLISGPFSIAMFDYWRVLHRFFTQYRVFQKMFVGKTCEHRLTFALMRSIFFLLMCSQSPVSIILPLPMDNTESALPKKPSRLGCETEIHADLPYKGRHGILPNAHQRASLNKRSPKKGPQGSLAGLVQHTTHPWVTKVDLWVELELRFTHRISSLWSRLWT